MCGFAKNRSTSSANRAIVSFGPSTSIPWSLWVLLIYSDRGSIAILNNNGGRGHPCLVLLCSCIGLDNDPGVRNLAVGLEYISCNICKIRPEKPMCSITSNSHDKETLSNAFSASNVTMTLSAAGEHLACSNATRTFLILATAYLPLMKPAYDGAIICGIKSAVRYYV